MVRDPDIWSIAGASAWLIIIRLSSFISSTLRLHKTVVCETLGQPTSGNWALPSKRTWRNFGFHKRRDIIESTSAEKSFVALWVREAWCFTQYHAEEFIRGTWHSSYYTRQLSILFNVLAMCLLIMNGNFVVCPLKFTRLRSGSMIRILDSVSFLIL